MWQVLKVPSILKREEIILLRKKYLPAVHRAYVKINDNLIKLSDRIIEYEKDGIQLSEQTQRRILRQLFLNLKELAQSNTELEEYTRKIFLRLRESIPS